MKNQRGFQRHIGLLAIAMLMMAASVAMAQPAAPDLHVVQPYYETPLLMHLAWSAVDSSEEYQYRVKADSGAYSSWISVGGDTTCDGIQVLQGPVYTFQVRARVGGIYSDTSSSRSSSAVKVWPVTENISCTAPECLELYHGFNQPILAGGNKYLHEGTDLHGGETTQSECVRAPLGGIIMYCGGAGSNICVNMRVRLSGQDLYIQFNHLETLNPGLTIGHSVAPGEHLGNINSNGFFGDVRNNHTHGHCWGTYTDMEGTTRNLLELWDQPGYRDPFGVAPVVENTDTTNAEPLRFRNEPDRSEYLPDDGKAYGAVDIVVEARDHQSTDAPWQVPERVGYYIQRVEGGIATDCVQSAALPYLLIDGSNWYGNPFGHTDSLRLHTIFDLTDSLRGCVPGTPDWYAYRQWFTYVVTNTYGTTGDSTFLDADQCWATNARNTETSPNGYRADYDSALVNEEAKFPDGRYRVGIRLEDFVNVAPDYLHDVYVDNFRPYVKSVEIRTDINTIYSAEWIWADSLLSLSPQHPDSGLVRVAGADQDITIRVTTSEPMMVVYIDTIETLGWASSGPAYVSPDSTYWSFVIPAEHIAGNGAADGKHIISISGLDFSGNTLQGFTEAKTIYSVSEIPRRQSDGSWSPAPIAGPDRVHRFLIGAANVSLVIDRSGSMLGESIARAKTASKQLVSLLDHGHFIAVSSFANGASNDYPLTRITSHQTKISAQTAIDGISAAGETSIGAGLQAGQNQLNAPPRPDFYPAMILFSDGHENRPPWAGDILPAIPEATDIYTVGIGLGADARLLSQIAHTTGGQYYYASTPGQLSDICEILTHTITGRQQLASHTGTVSGGGKEQIEHDVLIDGAMETATFSLLWQEAANDLDLELIGPDSTVIDSARAAAAPKIGFYRFPAVEFFSISYPDSGQWTLRIIGAAVDSTEEYIASAAGHTDLELDIGFSQDAYVGGDTVIVIAALLEDSSSVLGATVQAEITVPSSKQGEVLRKIYDRRKRETLDESPFPDMEELTGSKDSKTELLDLYDDGNHHDGAPNDGVYGNVFTNTSTVGSYPVTVAASGSATAAGPFTRRSNRAFFIQEPPQIALSAAEIDFGDVIVNTTHTLNLLIYNTADTLSADLLVSDIQPADPAFQPDTSDCVVSPGGFYVLPVSFTPATTDSFTSLLEIQSNDPDQPVSEVTLRGQGIPSPVISVTPDSLCDSLSTGQISIQGLQIFNLGSGDLYFGITLEETSTKHQDLFIRPRRNDRLRLSGEIRQANAEKSTRGAGDILDSYINFPLYNKGMIWAQDAMYRDDLYVVGWDSLYRYDPDIQQVVDRYPLHDAPSGIDWDGRHLWIGDADGRLFAYDLDGHIQNLCTGPVNDNLAIAWDGQHLLVNDRGDWDPMFYWIERDGIVVDSIPSHFAGEAGATVWVEKHDDGHLWATDNGNGRIVQVTLQDSMANTFSAFYFSGTDDAYSIAHDGTDLWWSDWDGPLYRLDDGIEEGPIWLSVDSLNGHVPPLLSTTIHVTFDATCLIEGDHHADIIIACNDPAQPQQEIRIPVYLGVPPGAPDIFVEPDTLSDTLFTDQTATHWLTISNQGVSDDLTFEIGIDESGEKLFHRQAGAPSDLKGSPDQRRDHLTFWGAGGPDDYGYRWMDSDDPGGPVFEWIDICSVGTQITLSDQDYEEMTLPFTFSFYGENKTTVKICSNGYLTFGSDGTDGTNDAIPDTTEPNDFIAVLWDDLAPNLGGTVHHYHDAADSRFIVQYTDIPKYSGEPYTFQAILNSDGSIMFQYLSLSAPLDEATIGIENKDATDGLQVAYNEYYLHDHLAVSITPGAPWVSVTPDSGVVPADSSMEIEVTFDAFVLLGEYSADLVIASNDPDEPEIRIPASLRAVADTTEPEQNWISFLGGDNTKLDWGLAIAADDAGNVYVTGKTKSSNFPITAGAYDQSYAGGYPYYKDDVFVTKIDPQGTALIYSTFLGGAEYEYGYGIAVDGMGCAYVTGTTSSSEFPTTPGAFDDTRNGYDAFVTKLNTAGSGLEYSTFLGGSSWEEGFAIALDDSDQVYLSGRTTSTDFPYTAGAYDTTYNGGFEDIFLAQLNAGGSDLLYATYLGGTDRGEKGYAIALGESGDIFIAGFTDSDDFPVTPGAFDTTFGGGYQAHDVFVARFNAAGDSLIYATFLGDDDDDEGLAIDIDASGCAYVTGYAASEDFPTTEGAYDRVHGGDDDAFVVKLNSDGSDLIYSTFLGSAGEDRGAGIVLSNSGCASVTGYTESADFPTTVGAFDEVYNDDGGPDVFVTRIDPDGGDLSYSTFIGGIGDDEGSAIALVGSGDVLVTGFTHSSDFPHTTGIFDSTYAGGDGDGFVARLAVGGEEDLTPPDPIDDLTIDIASGGKISSGDVYLVWSEPYDQVGVVRYVILRSAVAGSPGDSLAGTTDTVFVDSGAAGDTGTQYYYVVGAADAAGNRSEISNQVGEFDCDLINATSAK